MRKRLVLLGAAAVGVLAYTQRDRIISWFLTKVFDGMDDDEQNDQVVASNTPQVHDYLSRMPYIAQGLNHPDPEVRAKTRDVLREWESIRNARRAANALNEMWQSPSDPTSPLTGKPLPMSRDETVD